MTARLTALAVTLVVAALPWGARAGGQTAHVGGQTARAGGQTAHVGGQTGGPSSPPVVQPETVMSVPTRPGVTQSFVLVRPDRDPVGSVVLFPGGGGNLRLAQRRGLDGHTNFLVRNRERFAAHGFVVAVVDAPSDRATDGLTLFRSTAGHAQDVQAVIEALRRLSPTPVWLVGTSMGTVSAANAAARLAGGPAAPDGLVLTSSVTRPSRRERESLSDVRLGAVAVPTLIVHHKDDACPVTPHRDAAGLAKEL